jgi:hypothetical protein
MMSRRLPHWTCLADDTALVDLSGPAPMVSGTVLSGKEDHPRIGHDHPLRAVVALNPGAQDLRLQSLALPEAFGLWMERVFWFLTSGPTLELLTSLVEGLAPQVPAYRLESSLDHDLGSLNLAALAEAP